MKGYGMAPKNINMVYYADDVVLIADIVDNLQRLLFEFLKSASKYSMEVSREKNNCLTLCKELLRCKLEIQRY